MTHWITSDLHFSHQNSIKFCPKTRGMFSDTDEMNEHIISVWNRRVQRGDTAFILGDVAFCNAETAAGFIRRLNGKKILVVGNHDRKLLKHKIFSDCFSEIHSDWTGNYNGSYLHMYHFPICEWDQMHRGSVHLHGHLHQKDSGLEQYRARNVGWDYTGEVVSKLDDIIADAKLGLIREHH